MDGTSRGVSHTGRTARGEAGAALPEYVGVVAVMLLIVSVVVAAASPVGADVRSQLMCAVEGIGQEGVPENCADGTQAESGDTDPAGESCEESITVDSVHPGGGDLGTPIAQIGCDWYPIPPGCLQQEPDLAGLTLDAAGTGASPRVPGEGNEDIADCVTKGWPDPFEGDGPSANGSLNIKSVEAPGEGPGKQCDEEPADGKRVRTDPPETYIGCHWRPIPAKVCDEEWNAYKGAESDQDRAGAAGLLNDCVSEAYDDMEPDCTVAVTGHVENRAVSFLFFRTESSEAVLIERLGDDRIRVHILTGGALGAGFSLDVLGMAAFGVSAVIGGAKDTTYDFLNMEDAQAWIDWKAEEKNMKKPGDNSCIHYPQGNNTLQCPPTDGQIEKWEEHLENEPNHHLVQKADTHTKKVTFSGEIIGEYAAAGGVLGGSVGGEYEGEVEVEGRYEDNGIYEVSYTSNDVGGFLIGAALGGGRSFTSGQNQTAGAGSIKGGMSWKGTTKTTVQWNEDGELVAMWFTIDDEALQTLADAGIELEQELPFGFGLSGGVKNTTKEGSGSAKEFIVSFEAYPDLKEKFEPIIDELFPRGEDGKVRKGDVAIKPGVIGSAAEGLEEYGSVRDLKYDSEVTEKSVGGTVDFSGIDLFGAEWTSIDQSRDLTESEFTVVDVNGNRRGMSPSPKCAADPFEPEDENYYDNGKNKRDRPGGSRDNPKYTEGTYPGTDFDGEIPGEREERAKSLVAEYSKAFPDKNILIQHDDARLEFGPDVKGLEYLAKVDGFTVMALDSGRVENLGDGGWINWGFSGNRDRRGMTVQFKPKGE